MKIKVLFVAALLMPSITYSQYAPQAGVAGSTAIAATSGQFTSWATECHLSRGYQDIAQPTLGYTTTGDSSFATGMADNGIVSLGDGGIATLSFTHPITNGAGADFAVFENGFANPANTEEAFLELAFVEVSSDGVHFTRFPAISNIQNTAQIAGAGTYMNARYINNLAGKYTAGYGTPFDLQELSGTPNLDVNHIIQIRIIDVIGRIGTAGSKDSSGNIINDPYPTPFPTGGFDLDAVGVIHAVPAGINDLSAAISNITTYPNPATSKLYITLPGNHGQYTISLTTITGKTIVQESSLSQLMELDLTALPPGIYYLTATDEKGNQCAKKIVKN